jgi:DNA-binding NtrC family response regulator
VAVFKAGLTFGGVLFIIINKASSLSSIQSDRSGRSLPGGKGKGEEPMASVPKDSKGLRRMKWQLKDEAENEVEKAFLREALKSNRGNISKTALDVEMDRRQLQNLIGKHRFVSKEFKDSSSSAP